MYVYTPGIQWVIEDVEMGTCYGHCFIDPPNCRISCACIE